MKIVFCLSQRFNNDLENFAKGLAVCAAERGLAIEIVRPDFGWLPEELRIIHERERLKDHAYYHGVADKAMEHLFQNVKSADICFIFNKDGYIGVNTCGELFAAAAIGKPCYALHGDIKMGDYPHGLWEEPAVRRLVHGIASTPEELVKILEYHHLKNVVGRQSEFV